jgi:hypothetical protein
MMPILDDYIAETEFLKSKETDETGGKENAICVIAVSATGDALVITTINAKQAAWYYDDYLQDGMPCLDEEPGIYIIEFAVEEKRDYWGECDSWLEYKNIIKYKVIINDKRNSHDKNITYANDGILVDGNDNFGSEYPRCLFVVTDSGMGFVLDILNEDKAYKSIIEEITWYMEDIDNADPIICCEGIYIATCSIVGDMVNLLDRDENEDIKLTNIEQVELIPEKDDSPKSETFIRKEQEWRTNRLLKK